ncbi:MAG: MerR family transcriptional regulator [Planctomycetota bacterium]|jgi:DNA-binding transcriptional MerR regulator
MPDESSNSSHSPVEGIYSIGEIATATGVRPDTIRSWERKYGRPTPIRLPSGHRRYSEQDMRWLRRVAEALARGHRASVAVGATEAGLAVLLTDAEASPDPAISTLLAQVREYKQEAIKENLLESWNAMELVPFLEHIAFACQAVGRAWADGELDVRHEHFVSGLLADFLRGLRAGISIEVSDPIVVLATLPGELHGLGLQMAAVLCAQRGFAPRILGTETPVAELMRSAHELQAAAVAISVSLAGGGVEVDRILNELRRGLPQSTALVVGGAGARRGRSGARGAVYMSSFSDLDAWLARTREEER